MTAIQPTHFPPDPLVDEVRAIRRALSERFGNDVERLCDHLQELQQQQPERLVTPERRPSKKATRRRGSAR